MAQGGNASTQIPTIVWIFTGLICLYFGILYSISTYDNLVSYFVASRWNHTTGVMNESLKWSCQYRNTGNYPTDPKIYYEHINYSFYASGKAYTGSKYSQYGLCLLSLAALDTLQYQYLKGNQINVIYNPKNPNESYLTSVSYDFNNLSKAVLLFCGAAFFARGAVRAIDDGF